MEDKSSSKRKAELQTLRISEESERQLYDTLKHIYGPVCIHRHYYKFIIVYISLKMYYWKVTYFFNRVLNFLMHQNLKIKSPI